jgi:hypothetical protein
MLRDESMTRQLVALLIAGTIVACSAPSESGDEELARAMCSDLEAGLSLFQLHSQAVEHYRDGRSEDAAQLAAAELEDLATREYCPEFRDEFEATFVYEQWIAP